MEANVKPGTVCDAAIHQFERAGLGKAPYKYLGCEVRKYQACSDAPMQPGASCDYCGQGIMEVHLLLSSDGRRFKVGCDCIRKAGDAGLKAIVNREVSRMNAEKRHALAMAKAAEARVWVEDQTIAVLLAAEPHPSIPGKTFLDYCLWLLSNAGDKGRAQVHSWVKPYAEARQKERSHA